MKNFSIVYFLCITLFLPGMAAAQTKLPKLTVQEGFLNDKYSLAEKQTPAKDIRLHLEKNNAQAYHLWRAADKADAAGTVWGLLGLAGVVVAVTAKNTDTALIGSGVGVIGTGGALVCVINTVSKRKKSIKAYNTGAGY
jgi:hypothetical protein